LAAFHPALLEVKVNLRLSKKQESALAFFVRSHAIVTESSFKHQAYLWGKEKTFELILLQTARRLADSEITLKDGVRFLKDIHRHFDRWVALPFPLTGQDLLSQGVKEGEKIGILLKAVEMWWISQDLNPDRRACLEYLSTLL
ncbi:MAG TPA: hypothetical protein VMW10_13070, partial [Alphaproteobacteria bacterium]|nr:hypothetical protein [Alphaproteobacteria bacterium]